MVETIVGKRRAAPRLLWIAPSIAVAGVIGTAGWFVRHRVAEIVAGAPAATAAQTASSGAEVAAAEAPAPSASSTAEAAAPSASSTAEAAAPSASASAATPAGAHVAPRPKVHRKYEPPRAPKDIRF